MPESAKPAHRRAGRRGLAIFFGAIGLFFMTTHIFEMRDSLELKEQRIQTKLRGTEQVNVSPARVRIPTIPKADAEAVRKLRQHLYIAMGAGALALLLTLLLALSGQDPQWYAAALAALAVMFWLSTGEFAAVSPFLLAGFVVQIPEEIWNPPPS